MLSFYALPHRAKVGATCWTFLVVMAVNVLWCGLRQNPRVSRAEPTEAQKLALGRIRRAVEYFMDSLDGAAKGKVPRTPSTGWASRVRNARVSYTGEVLMKVEALEVERVEVSLPPAGHGGCVDILEVVDEEVKAKLSDPHSCLLADHEVPDRLPEPKVRVKDKQWPALARLLFERKIVKPVSEVAKVKGKPLLNGLFGVEKANKTTSSGAPSQRLIMDMRAVNAVMKPIAGDLNTLTGALAFTNLVLGDGNVITLCGDDLQSSFYLFSLPDTWLPFMGFEKRVSWQDLGVDRPGDTWLAAAVLPMGFISSVAVMQHIHRRLALWQPPWGAGLPPCMETQRGHCTSMIPPCCGRSRKRLGRPFGGARPMNRSLCGGPTNTGGSLTMSQRPLRMQLKWSARQFMDGKEGRIGTTTARNLEILSLGLWLCSQEGVSVKSLQVFGGKECHCLQFRRPLFSVYDGFWKQVATMADGEPLTEDSMAEILISLMLMPMRFTDWRAQVDPVVMASDASEKGGGFVLSHSLSLKGEKDLRALLQVERQQEEHLVVFDFFAGIGGLLRSLERAGLHPSHWVTVERDKACRRLLRRVWPGGSEHVDIETFAEADILRELDKVAGVRAVIAGGGSPCQGLSKLSSERQGLEDCRSKLFFTLAEKLRTIQKVCRERRIRFGGFVENVVCDEADRDAMSYELGWKPVKIEAGDVSWVKRPRYYWLSEQLPERPWFNLQVGEVADECRMEGTCEKKYLWLPQGWSWPSEKPEARFATFTRPISATPSASWPAVNVCRGESPVEGRFFSVSAIHIQ